MNKMKTRNPDGSVEPNYQAWISMRRRCSAASWEDFKNYGGRGIKVCTQWQDSFETFFKDMGPRPSGIYSLERKNTDGDYTPDNCYWATLEQQNNNKRKQRNNKSGLTGVHYIANRGIWQAHARGVRLYHGPNFFEACCARKSWEVHHGSR